ncbi:hypothetical protein ACFFK0_26830 [Paenibacillus chartarius]|uniref:Uncharacterized protein n=1 Tax=Paenibacillus chartarius TaxID=747481 RepID=A0ABV6DTN5_9BACL
MLTNDRSDNRNRTEEVVTSLNADTGEALGSVRKDMAGASDGIVSNFSADTGDALGSVGMPGISQVESAETE